MESESSLPHSQVPATCPCPEPARFRPCTHFLKFQLSTILPYTPGSCKWFLSLMFPHQNLVYASPLYHTCYMPRPSHSSPCYHQNDTGWGVQILSSSLCSFLHSPVTSSLLGPTSYSQTSSTYVPPSMWATKLSDKCFEMRNIILIKHKVHYYRIEVIHLL
jgi:hypothetical protein